MRSEMRKRGAKEQWRQGETMAMLNKGIAKSPTGPAKTAEVQLIVGTGIIFATKT